MTASADTRLVTVIVRAAVTDQVMTGWDENGGMYETQILGHRRFFKVLDLPVDRNASPRIEINGHGYRPGAGATWSEANEGVKLLMPLSEADNGPLEDCMKDATWTEIAEQPFPAGVPRG